MSERYARQARVLGPEAQAAIRAGEVEVGGDGLDALICALYVAGAGVARLRVDALHLARVQAQNGHVEVTAGPRSERLVVHVGDHTWTSDVPEPLSRGASAARWALMALVDRRGTSP